LERIWLWKLGFQHVPRRKHLLEGDGTRG
jgi:hypothetical protein